MPPPTEPGWYWWTGNSGSPVVLRIMDDGWVLTPDGCALPSTLSGVWGQRIPSPQRLKAMQAVCEAAGRMIKAVRPMRDDEAVVREGAVSASDWNATAEALNHLEES